jgi:hypothetical protein
VKVVFRTAILLLLAAGATAAANPQRPAINLKGEVRDRVIGPLNLSGAFRAIESNPQVRVRNLTIRGITATDLERDGIRIRGDAVGVNIRDFRLSMRAQPQSGRNLPIGIAVQEGRDIVIEDGSASGFRMVERQGKYTNGDGVATERPVDGLTINRVRASDNSDGGFDLKSSRTSLDRLTAERNGRNYRFWRTVRAGTLTSADPRNAHVWLARGAEVRIARLAASSRGRAPLVRIEGPASITIDRCDLRLPPGTPLVAGDRRGSRISLGAGCRT